MFWKTLVLSENFRVTDRPRVTHIFEKKVSVSHQFSTVRKLGNGLCIKIKFFRISFAKWAWIRLLE